jgi:hypothetical protein
MRQRWAVMLVGIVIGERFRVRPQPAAGQIGNRVPKY